MQQSIVSTRPTGNRMPIDVTLEDVTMLRWRLKYGSAQSRAYG